MSAVVCLLQPEGVGTISYCSYHTPQSRCAKRTDAGSCTCFDP